MSDTNSNINSRIAIGAGWNISLRWTDRFIGLISIAILARLLLPADFGLVGYALIILAILDEFSRFSFETILIRDQDTAKDKYNTVWTFEVIKGLALSIIVAITARPISIFFNEPQLESILFWFALVPILMGVKNIGTVDFQKDLRFDKEFYFDVTVRLIGTITTVVLALILRNFWALVYGAIFRAVIRVVLSYLMCDFRPRPSFSQYSSILSFSKWLLVQNIISSSNARLPAILIGRYFDAQALAFFNMGRELTDLVKNELGAPIRRALYPGITKMQDDNSQIAAALKMTMGIIALISLPAVVGIGITAPLLIPAFLGSNWTEVAPIVQVLSINAAIYMYYPNSHVILFALGKPKIVAYISILRLCILVPTVFLVVPDYGVLGAAWSLVVVNGVVMIFDYLVLLRMKAISLSSVLTVVWRSTFAVIFMAICVAYILDQPPVPSIQESTILHLTLCIVTGVLSYATAISTLWLICGSPDGPEAYVVRTLKRLRRRELS